MVEVSFIIPAYNEEERIEKTLRSLKSLRIQSEIIVIDDGSKDKTAIVAKRYADHVISLSTNCGKGYALQVGWGYASGTYIASVDADLGESANEIVALLEPLKEGKADFTISNIKAGKRAGFGFVKRRARSIIYRETGMYMEAPLSGQRMFHRKWLPIVQTRRYYRFGVETMMNIDLIRAGARFLEVPTSMSHREMGKTVRGMFHRLKQWIEIERQCWENRT